MKLKTAQLVFVAALLLGCSNDDNSSEPIQVVEPASFVVIGEDADRVYQFSYNAESDLGTTADLTGELGINSNYLTFRQPDKLISFYSFADGFFSLAQKNIETDQTINYDNFYENNPGRSIAWGTNNDSNVFFGYFGPNGSRNLSIQDIELSSDERIDVTIDFNIESVDQPLYFEDKVYVSYRDSQGDSKLTFYNTNTKSAGPKLDLGTTTISFFATNDSNIGVIKNGTTPTLAVYDGSTFVLLESFPLDFGTGFDSGPIFDLTLNGSSLYYARTFAQPSRFQFGPAVFDLERQQDFILDLGGIVEEVEQQIGTGVTPSFQVYDTASQLFLVGYAQLGNEIKGGVMQISNDGRLVANIEFPFFPTNILKN